MIMEIRFDGKKALVTGAGRGIGRSIATALANGGAETHALSRTKADLDSLKKEVPKIFIHQVDLTDWEKTRKIVQDNGPFDLLVNNAAIFVSTTFLETTESDFDKLFDTNMKAVFNISQLVAKGMVQRAVGGSIVNISSIAAERVMTDISVPGIIKSALDMMTKVMAYELGPYKIRVNSVQPSFVMTDNAKKYIETTTQGSKLAVATMERTPLGQFAEPEDVVHPVLYLLSDKSGMITGTEIPVDGGFLVT